MLKNLTNRFCECVTTTKLREEFRDQTVRGLQLRVTKAGIKTWTFRYRRQSDAQLQRLTLGLFPVMGLAEARTRALEEGTKAARGGDPADEVKRRKEADTFKELADDWLERHAVPNKGAKAVRDDRSMLERHILPEIGKMKIAEIRKRDVLRMLDVVVAKSDTRGPDSKTRGKQKRNEKKPEKPKAPRRLSHRPNRVFELTRAIFRWAVSRDILQIDPTYMLKAPIKREKERERVLDPDEIRRLWSVLDRAPVVRRGNKGVPRGQSVLGPDDVPMTKAVALVLKLALATGQRIGEVSGIHKSELNLEGPLPMWMIPGERCKNGKANRVPLSPIAVSLIKQAIALNETSVWVFPGALGDDSAMDPHAPTKAVERARKMIAIGDFRAHDLRRTAATGMAEAGINPHTISLVLNHISARKGTITGRVYVQYSYDREKRDALLAWGTRLVEILAETAARSDVGGAAHVENVAA